MTLAVCYRHVQLAAPTGSSKENHLTSNLWSLWRQMANTYNKCLCHTHTHTLAYHTKQSHFGECCIMSAKSHFSHAVDDDEGAEGPFICFKVTVVSQCATLRSTCGVCPPLAFQEPDEMVIYHLDNKRSMNISKSWGLQVKRGPSNLVFRQS